MAIIIQNFYKRCCKTAAADNCYGIGCCQLIWFCFRMPNILLKEIQKRVGAVGSSANGICYPAFRCKSSPPQLGRMWAFRFNSAASELFFFNQAISVQPSFLFSVFNFTNPMHRFMSSRT
jgi:hypothetical protein